MNSFIKFFGVVSLTCLAPPYIEYMVGQCKVYDFAPPFIANMIGESKIYEWKSCKGDDTALIDISYIDNESISNLHLANSSIYLLPGDEATSHHFFVWAERNKKHFLCQLYSVKDQKIEFHFIDANSHHHYHPYADDGLLFPIYADLTFPCDDPKLLLNPDYHNKLMFRIGDNWKRLYEKPYGSSSLRPINGMYVLNKRGGDGIPITLGWTKEQGIILSKYLSKAFDHSQREESDEEPSADEHWNGILQIQKEVARAREQCARTFGRPEHRYHKQVLFTATITPDFRMTLPSYVLDQLNSRPIFGNLGMTCKAMNQACKDYGKYPLQIVDLAREYIGSIATPQAAASVPQREIPEPTPTPAARLTPAPVMPSTPTPTPTPTQTPVPVAVARALIPAWAARLTPTPPPAAPTPTPPPVAPMPASTPVIPIAPISPPQTISPAPVMPRSPPQTISPTQVTPTPPPTSSLPTSLLPTTSSQSISAPTQVSTPTSTNKSESKNIQTTDQNQSTNAVQPKNVGIIILFITGSLTLTGIIFKIVSLIHYK